MGAAASGFLVPGLDMCRVSERAVKAMGALGMYHPGFEKLFRPCMSRGTCVHVPLLSYLPGIQIASPISHWLDWFPEAGETSLGPPCLDKQAKPSQKLGAGLCWTTAVMTSAPLPSSSAARPGG